MKIQKPTNQQKQIVRPKILLIDGNNIVARMTHTHRGLKSPNGEFSGACYGIIRSLRPFLIENPGFVSVFFVEDSGVPEFRKKLIAANKDKEYKSSRKERADDGFVEEYHQQMDTTPPVLRTLGIHTTYAPKFEADDVISALSTELRGSNDVVVFSGDADLIQLAGEGVSVYRPHLNEFVTVCAPDFLLKKAIVGDTSDDIIGVAGIGKVRVEKLMSSVGWCGIDLNIFFDSLDRKDKYQEKVAHEEDRVRRNYEAMDLSNTVESCLDSMVIEEGLFDRRAFMEVCHERRYRELLKNLDFYTGVFAKLT